MVVRLVPSPPRLPDFSPRLWLIFFCEADRAHWWTFLFRRGFRHIRAAAWFEGAQRWVYYDPCARGTFIEIATADEFGPRFTQLVSTSTVILRIASEFGRGRAPAGFYCVAAIKALLGIRSCALSPKGLHDHLLARGAKPVARPNEADLGIPSPETSSAAAGGSFGEGAARSGAGAG